MWIILEGIDGAGKTPVADYLHSRGWWKGHTGPPGQGGSFPELLANWWRCEDRAEPGEPWVWDRGHLGELFCGPVRRGTTLTEASKNALEALLLDRAAQVWWVDPYPHKVQSDVPLEDRVSEQMHLQEAVRRSRVVVRRFASVEEALDHARLYEGPTPCALHPVLDYLGAGTRTPRWWVLGEQKSRAASCGFPFITPAGQDMLWPWVNPTSVRVSNVLAPEEDLGAARSGRFPLATMERLEEWWTRLGRPQVLTLGGTAEAACRTAGLPIAAKLRHPQYVKRFYHAEVGRWSREFQEIVGS